MNQPFQLYEYNHLSNNHHRNHYMRTIREHRLFHCNHQIHPDTICRGTTEGNFRWPLIAEWKPRLWQFDVDTEGRCYVVHTPT